MINSTKKVHFIAVGGAVMHNLALALHQKGYQVSGSDDEIYEPAKSRLDKVGILPNEYGWFPDKINIRTTKTGSYRWTYKDVITNIYLDNYT